MTDPIVCDSFVVVEWTASADNGPDRPIAALHVHHADDEAWIVQTGRLGVQVGDTVQEAGPGESVLVTRGVPHTYWNAGSEPARYLLVMTPRLHHLIQQLHSGERSDYAEIFREHQSELL